MALWWCAGCSAAYAVGLPACPNCGSTDRTEEDTMPKITNHGGPSNYAADYTEPDAAPSDTTEEESSPGTSSSTSSSKAASSAKQSSSEGRSPARTTANRSKQARTAASSARGTAGSPEAATSPTADGGEG